MIHFDQEKLDRLNNIYKINLINSCSGYKPANLIATVSKNGIENVAIFSSVVHIGSNPPLLGFIVLITFLNLSQMMHITLRQDMMRIYQNLMQLIWKQSTKKKSLLHL